MIGILNIFGVIENASKIINKIKDSFSRKQYIINRLRNLRNVRNTRRSKTSEAIEQRTNSARNRNRKPSRK